MGRVLGLHHVAFAHRPGEKPHLRLQELFGLTVSHVEDGDGFIERMAPLGEAFLQTLEATGPGVVSRFVDRQGSGLHHIALRVDDLIGILSQLSSIGVEVIEPAPRPGGMGTRVAFLHPRSTEGLLVELVETPKDTGRSR